MSNILLELKVGAQCKPCKSKQLRKLEGELTLSLADQKALKVLPVYICQSVLVCLDCGFAVVIIPPGELQSLKKEITTPGA
jgi:hypothetical protein